MTLPTNPPDYHGSFQAIVASINVGEKGWRAWAIQNVLRHDGAGIEADGAFGPKTEAAAKAWQKKRGLVVDGKVGPTTQLLMLEEAEHDVHAQLPRLPEGVLKGFSVAEGGSVLAATNWYTPPRQAPGVDLGPMQNRYLLAIPQAKIKEGFDPRASMLIAGRHLLERIDAIETAQPQLGAEFELRAALMGHNAPFMYDQIRRHGKLTTPNARPTSGAWAVNPAGGWFSHAEWLQVYPNRILVYIP